MDFFSQLLTSTPGLIVFTGGGLLFICCWLDLKEDSDKFSIRTYAAQLIPFITLFLVLLVSSPSLQGFRFSYNYFSLPFSDDQGVKIGGKGKNSFFLKDKKTFENTNALLSYVQVFKDGSIETNNNQEKGDFLLLVNKIQSGKDNGYLGGHRLKIGDIINVKNSNNKNYQLKFSKNKDGDYYFQSAQLKKDYLFAKTKSKSFTLKKTCRPYFSKGRALYYLDNIFRQMNESAQSSPTNLRKFYRSIIFCDPNLSKINDGKTTNFIFIPRDKDAIVMDSHKPIVSLEIKFPVQLKVYRVSKPQRKDFEKICYGCFHGKLTTYNKFELSQSNLSSDFLLIRPQPTPFVFFHTETKKESFQNPTISFGAKLAASNLILLTPSKEFEDFSYKIHIDRKKKKITFTGSNGSLSANFSENILIPKDENSGQINLKFELLGFPWWLIGIYLVFLALKLFLLWNLKLNPSKTLLYSLLSIEYFVFLKLLFSFKASFLSPYDIEPLEIAILTLFLFLATILVVHTWLSFYLLVTEIIFDDFASSKTSKRNVYVKNLFLNLGLKYLFLLIVFIAAAKSLLYFKAGEHPQVPSTLQEILSPSILLWIWPPAFFFTWAFSYSFYKKFRNIYFPKLFRSTNSPFKKILEHPIVARIRIKGKKLLKIKDPNHQPLFASIVQLYLLLFVCFLAWSFGIRERISGMFQLSIIIVPLFIFLFAKVFYNTFLIYSAELENKRGESQPNIFLEFLIWLFFPCLAFYSHLIDDIGLFVLLSVPMIFLAVALILAKFNFVKTNSIRIIIGQVKFIPQILGILIIKIIDWFAKLFKKIFPNNLETFFIWKKRLFLTHLPQIKKYFFINGMMFLFVGYILFLIFPQSLYGAFLYVKSSFQEKLEIVETQPQGGLDKKNSFLETLIASTENKMLYRLASQKDLVSAKGDINFQGIDEHLFLLESYSLPGTQVSQVLFGNGYLRNRIHPSLNKVGLNDNAVGVFMLSEFGLFGFLGCLMALGIFALVWAFNIKHSPKIIFHEYLRWVICFFLSSALIIYAFLYMTGVNYNVWPLTGKNIYFWGLNSKSDSLEAILLFGLLVFSQMLLSKKIEQ